MTVTLVDTFECTPWTTNYTITVPSGVKVGDLCLVIAGRDDASAASWTLIGWTTVLADTVASNSNWRIMAKVMEASDLATIATSGPISGTLAAMWFRNAKLGAVGTPWIRSVSDTSITSPSVTRTDAGSSILCLAGDRTIAVSSGDFGYSSFTGAATILHQFHGNPTLSASLMTCASHWAMKAPADAAGDINWTMNDSAGNAMGLQIELVPEVYTPIIEDVTVWDGTQEITAGVTVWSGSEELPATEVRPIPAGYSSYTDMLSRDTFYIAHRGGSLNWPEMSMHAYTQALDWGATGALEISVARTSDGVFFGLHDQTLVRTSPEAPATAVSSLTWAQVQSYTIVSSATTDPAQPRQPYMRLEDLLSTYGNDCVLFIDPKYVGSANWGAMWTLILSYVPISRVVGKYFFTSQNFANDCAGRGIPTWGYLYQTDLPDLDANADAWSMLGMQHDATQTTWNTVLAKGKPVIGHICASITEITSARSKGASGCMVSGVTSLPRFTESINQSGPYVASTSTINGGNSGSLTVPLPSDIQSGDLLITIVSAQTWNTTDRLPEPSGWTKELENPAGTSSGSTRTHSVFSLAVSNPASVTAPVITTTAITGDRRNAVMLCIRNGTTITATSSISAGTLSATFPTVSTTAGSLAIGVDYAVMASGNVGTVAANPGNGWVNNNTEVANPVADGSASSDWLRTWSKVADGSTVGGETVLRTGPTIAAGAAYTLVIGAA